MTKLVWHRVLRDVVLIVCGTFICAVGYNCFEIPNGLAAGGVTGLATVINELTGAPVGVQTIAMNAVLFLVAIRQGGKRYLAKTAFGVVSLGFFIDVLRPLLPVLGEGDLLLCALWGGVITGVGLGLVFRTGGTTGGTDIIAQVISSRTSISMGTACILVDTVVIVASAMVFSIEQALYAAVAMYITGKAIDMTVDGPRTERAAYVISSHHDEIADVILRELDRGCTILEARGAWSGERHPVLFCVLGRGETGLLKQIVAKRDPDAIVFISEVHEAFGEGFRQMDGG